MAGRNRRANVARDRAGRIKAAEYRRDFDNGAAKWAKVRDLLREIAGDPRLSGELGRRHFLGDITPVQYQAGLSYGSMLAVYDWKVLCVRRSVPSHILDRVGGTEDAERWDDGKLLTFKARFLSTDEALKIEGGRNVYDATRALCRGEYAAIAPAKRGLDLLMNIFRIDPTLDGEEQITNDEKRKVLTSASG